MVVTDKSSRSRHTRFIYPKDLDLGTDDFAHLNGRMFDISIDTDSTHAPSVTDTVPEPQAHSVSVIVPTCNEAGNVSALVARLAGALHTETFDWELIFVDDSDDNTPEVVWRERESHHQIQLVHRSESERVGGLAGAVQTGITQARGDVLVVMAGDLQHPPEIVPRLIAPIIDGRVDLVVGTRYGAGGNSAGLNGWYRRLVSGSCRSLVHLLVRRSRPLSDPLSGMFAVNSAVLQGVRLQGQGFKILLEVVARGRWNSCADVPFDFAERQAGSSKADLHEGIVFARHLAGIYRAERRRRSGHLESSPLHGGVVAR